MPLPLEDPIKVLNAASECQPAKVKPVLVGTGSTIAEPAVVKLEVAGDSPPFAPL